MGIMNRDRNMINLYYEVVCFYTVNCRLNVLIDGSWSISDSEVKVL